MVSSVRVNGEYGQEQEIWVGVGNMGRNGEDGQGQAYRIPIMDQRGKVRIVTEKVIETKQGSLETRMG